MFRNQLERAKVFTIFPALVISGGITFYLSTISPMLEARAANTWKEQPCIILAKETQKFTKKNSDSYKAHITYAYTFKGHQYQADRYDFSTENSTYDSQVEIIDRYEIGSQHTCFINPDNPREAVLERSYLKDYFLSIISLGLFITGVIGMIYLKVIGFSFFDITSYYIY